MTFLIHRSALARLARFSALTVLTGTALLAARPALTQDSDSTELVFFRTALDQLAAGKPANARLLLENAGAGSRSPESALLLVYLQEKAGDQEAARATLTGVRAPSGLTRAYLNRLTGGRAVQTAAAPAAAAPGTTAAAAPVAHLAALPAAGGARLAATDSRLTALERSMWRLVNEERKRHGLGDLEYDDRLAEVARAHSAEMRDKNYFAHESPTPGLRDPMDRFVKGMETTPRFLAENVYRVWGSRSFLTEPDTRSAHNALMNSPGHRANILEAKATRIGIGFVTDATGNLWITQMFSKPR